MQKTIVLLVSLLAMPTSYAASTPTSYDVEIVIFENRAPELDGGELWSNNTNPVADLAQAVTPGEPSTSPSTLANTVAALQRDGRYHVLTYKRWRQGADERSATKPVRLADDNGELSGVFRFYMSRFLHVDLDLALKQQNSEPVYRLNERRRIKTQETNYFDHPKFGALVKITPAEKE